MTVPVVDIREMWVTVGDCLVNVSVGMRLSRRVIRGMGMLVMRVVSV